MHDLPAPTAVPVGTPALSATIAWDAMAFQPLPGKPTNQVVTLGESYASGDGGGAYYPNTATGPYSIDSKQPTDPGFNRCLRSRNSWIRNTIIPVQSQTLGVLADAWDSSTDLQSVACSGAVTVDVDPGVLPGINPMNFAGDGEYGEVPQLYSGVLDANTTLVAMTMGGDDAGFASIATACLTIFTCPSSTTVDAKLDAATTKVGQLIEAIRNEAPNAKIVLLGYPELFDISAGASLCGSAMPEVSRVALNGWADDLATKQNAMVATEAAKGIQVVFKWPNGQFDGHHDCDSPSGINDAVPGPTADDPSDNSCPNNPICPSVSTMHPTVLGYQLYAQALEQALAGK